MSKQFWIVWISQIIAILHFSKSTSIPPDLNITLPNLFDKNQVDDVGTTSTSIPKLLPRAGCRDGENGTENQQPENTHHKTQAPKSKDNVHDDKKVGTDNEHHTKAKKSGSNKCEHTGENRHDHKSRESQKDGKNKDHDEHSKKHDNKATNKKKKKKKKKQSIKLAFNDNFNHYDYKNRDYAFAPTLENDANLVNAEFVPEPLNPYGYRGEEEEELPRKPKDKDHSPSKAKNEDQLPSKPKDEDQLPSKPNDEDPDGNDGCRAAEDNHIHVTSRAYRRLKNADTLNSKKHQKRYQHTLISNAKYKKYYFDMQKDKSSNHIFKKLIRMYYPSKYLNIFRKGNFKRYKNLIHFSEPRFYIQV